MGNGKKLVVVIPAFDEERTIGEVIKGIPRRIDGISDIQIVVIDDGSSDNTKKIAKDAGADIVLSHSTNIGLGRSFLDGIKQALSMDADLIVTIDADGQFEPKEIPHIIKDVRDGKSDLVLGSRFLDKKSYPEMSFIKRFGNSIFRYIVNRLTNQDLSDTQCGFRVYSREAALNINSFGRHTYTQEVIITLAKKRFRITEFPCMVNKRGYGKSKIADNVLLYGLKAMIILMQTVRDYSPILFFGSIGMVFLLLGLFVDFVLFVRWLLVGVISPYRLMVTLASLSIVLGVGFIILSFVVDMLDRHRRITEEILYEMRKSKKT